MTELLDAAHRRRWQEAMVEAAEGQVPTPDCPAPERIWEASRGELSGAEVRELLDHVTGCAACSLAWRLAAEVDAGDRMPDVEPQPSRRPPWRRGLAAAAAVVALALVAPLLVERLRPPSDELRDAPALAIHSLVEGQTLDRQDCLLRWTPVPESLSYSVLVGSEELDVLLRGVGLASPELRVPAESLEPLPSGASLVWRVDARLEDGSHLRSPSFVNRVE